MNSAIIVFSKDRALQLHAFLRSFDHYVDPVGIVKVLYASSSLRHERAYREVFDFFSFAIPCAQSHSFKNDLLSLIPRGGNVTFFVDDIVFVRSWNRFETPGLSLRHGIHLTHNYSTAGALQPLPNLYPCGEELVTWKWSEGQLAWAYPLSTDGHVYDAIEMSDLAQSVHFTSPNTFEAAMQAHVSRFMDRWGICYHHAKVVNVPWNRVQTDYENRFSRNVLATSDELLFHWESGKQIDLRIFEGQVIQSVHQEFPLTLESR